MIPEVREQAKVILRQLALLRQQANLSRGPSFFRRPPSFLAFFPKICVACLANPAGLRLEDEDGAAEARMLEGEGASRFSERPGIWARPSLGVRSFFSFLCVSSFFAIFTAPARARDLFDRVLSGAGDLGKQRPPLPSASRCCSLSAHPRFASRCSRRTDRAQASLPSLP